MKNFDFQSILYINKPEAPGHNREAFGLAVFFTTYKPEADVYKQKHFSKKFDELVCLHFAKSMMKYFVYILAKSMMKQFVYILNSIQNSQIFRPHFENGLILRPHLENGLIFRPTFKNGLIFRPKR